MNTFKGNSSSPDQPSDERDHGGHARFRKQAHLSRRQFVITSAGATGALLTSGLWMPALAHRALEVPTLAHFVPGVTVKRGDLVCVKVRNTGTGKAEVHILTAASNYQQFRLETGTPINEVDASDNYSFTQMAVGDLVAVKSRNTGISGKAGVHILTAASNYQQFRLEKDTPIDEVDASDNYSFTAMTSSDLMAIKLRNTGTGKAEVHILTAASNYQQFGLETGIPINEVDASDNYSFATMANGDLMAVKLRNTGISGKAGVHILTAASHYQQFGLEKDTPINEVDASDNYVFVCVK